MPRSKSSTLALCLIFASAAILGRVSAWTCNSTRNVTLTKSMLDDLKQLIKNKMSNESENDLFNSGKQFKKLVPGFVRLPFHSCSAKWCSSRIVVGDPLNSGLQHVVEAANNLHATIQNMSKYTGFSKADLYALCGVTALEEATGGRIQVKFRYGRPDVCSPADENSLGQQLAPDTLDTSQTYAFMKKVFNFTPIETATIMGAHSLGVFRNSENPPSPLWRWAQTAADRLTNNYYQQLLDQSWQQSNRFINRKKRVMSWQNNKSGRLVMLNSDIGLVRLVISSSKDNSGSSTCKQYLSCNAAPTNSTIWEYAENETKFLDAFSIVFGKMIENGLSGKLREVVA